MKNVVFAVIAAVALGLNAYAACNGPYCWDDTGAQIQTGITLQSRTLAQVQATIPASAGVLLYCSDCVSTPVCISTGTTVYGFAGVSVSTSATTGKGACK